MPNDTFWADTMDILLSDSTNSFIEGPQMVIEHLATHLSSHGNPILRIEESNSGTKRIHPHRKVFLKRGADSALVAQVEEFLTTRKVHFTRHEMVNDSDHIDLSYDLNNVSVWKSET